MQIINKVVKSLIWSLNYIVPKKRNKVMFASFPDFSDNARALYEYMVSQERFKDWAFVWEVSKGYMPEERRNTLFIKKPLGYWNRDYFRYLWHLMTSKYLLTTHSFFGEAVPSRQVSVLLWHGTMLKRICAMNEREKVQGGKPQYRYFVSPSQYYVQYFCKSFLCREEQVQVTGYPRNDFLFQETDVLERLGIQRESFEKIIVYMPTFRTPLGGGYSDSSDSKQMCLDLENKDAMEDLSEFLLERKLLLIIKWHPSDIRQTLSYELNNIVFIKNRQLVDIDRQVYHLLHYADAMVTDYSSVFCDYLVLGRPIAFDISDIESYSDKRGFVFDEPLEYMPGVKISTEEDFRVFCDDIANGVDCSQSERERLKMVYNDFADGKNCQRLLRAVGI